MKRYSLSLHGHRTSVSLEPEFWAALNTTSRPAGPVCGRAGAKRLMMSGQRKARRAGCPLRCGVYVLTAAQQGQLLRQSVKAGKDQQAA